MKTRRILSIIGLILAACLLLGIGYVIGRRYVPSIEEPRLYTLSEFEETVLNGKEFKRLPPSYPVFYAAYEPSYPSLYLYLLEAHGDGQYTLAVLSGGIGYTIDCGKTVAAEFEFLPLQMKMIFSPAPIDPHEGYQETVFSDAYLYTSEDYTVVYPIDAYQQRLP